MTEQSTLRKSLVELETALKSGTIAPDERTRLERLHGQLSAALAQKETSSGGGSGLRSELRTALERAEKSHPHLTSALSRVLDTLSEIGV